MLCGMKKFFRKSWMVAKSLNINWFSTKESSIIQYWYRMWYMYSMCFCIKCVVSIELQCTRSCKFMKREIFCRIGLSDKRLAWMKISWTLLLQYSCNTHIIHFHKWRKDDKGNSFFLFLSLLPQLSCLRVNYKAP